MAIDGDTPREALHEVPHVKPDNQPSHSSDISSVLQSPEPSLVLYSPLPASLPPQTQTLCPHPVRHPQEEWLLQEWVGRGGWLSVEGFKFWLVLPQAEVVGGEDYWPSGCPPEECLAHPLLLLVRQRLSIAHRQQLQSTPLSLFSLSLRI